MKSSAYTGTVWKNEKFTVTHKKFRQINSLVFSLEKRYFHEIFVSSANFRNFHTVTGWKNQEFTVT